MKRFIALSLALVFCSQVGITTLVHASETKPSNSEVTGNNQLMFSTEELRNMGFTETEIIELENYETSGIYLINGVAYNAQGVIIDNGHDVERGKLSWAVKAIKAGIDKLPPAVKNMFAGSIFYKAMDLLEHYTGTLEDGLTTAFIGAGLSKGDAEFVSKTIMLFIF